MTVLLTIFICWCIFGVLLIIADSFNIISFENDVAGLIMCGPAVWACVGLVIAIVAISKRIGRD